MLECRPMFTPLVTKLRKIDALGSKVMDATLYHQLIGLLMYLLNTRPIIRFAINSLNQFKVIPRRVHLVATKHAL